MSSLEIDRLPCVIFNVNEDEYHGHRESLSHSGAKKLLDTCPAKFRYEQDHPGERKKSPALELGSLAHAWILEGPKAVKDRYYRLPPDHSNATKDGKKLVADLIEAGLKPVDHETYKTVSGMVAAIQAHPIYALFEQGRPEVAMFWKSDFGIMCRAKLDWLPGLDGLQGVWRRVIPDYKTTNSGHPDDVKKSVWNFSYYMQDHWYSDGLISCGLREDPIFQFVFQEKDPPYIITIVEMDEESRELGRRHKLEALDLYKRCVDSGKWPMYSDSVIKLSLPRWAGKQS